MAIIKEFGTSYVSASSEIATATKINQVKQGEVKNFDRIYQEWKLNNCNKRQCDIMGIITQIGNQIQLKLKSGESKTKLSMVLLDDSGT
jgi:hypothetical protein